MQWVNELARTHVPSVAVVALGVLGVLGTVAKTLLTQRHERRMQERAHQHAREIQRQEHAQELAVLHATWEHERKVRGEDHAASRHAGGGATLVVLVHTSCREVCVHR